MRSPVKAASPQGIARSAEVGACVVRVQLAEGHPVRVWPPKGTVDHDQAIEQAAEFRAAGNLRAVVWRWNGGAR